MVIAQIYIAPAYTIAAKWGATGLLLVAGATLGALAPHRVQAQSFIIESGEVETTPQTLDNLGDTGLIETGGSLAVTGAVAVLNGVAGDNARITNSGTISTEGLSADGVRSQGDDLVLVNHGTITTGGANARGVVASASDAAITNSGVIRTIGGFSPGVFLNGVRPTFANSGTIEATGSNSQGIASTASDAVITNSGEIRTSNGVGILASGGSGAVVTNSGTIEASGSGSQGIASTASDAVITNSGTIRTSNGVGILSSGGSDAVITNSGTIGTAGFDNDGIFSDGDNAMITNSGTIGTDGNDAEGIISFGDNAAITNSGTIETARALADGISSLGDKALITNSGTIETAADNADGIRFSGDNAVITNSGVIATAGVNAEGVFSTGDNAAIMNSGTIRVTGAGSAAISLGDDNTLTNTGSLIATGDATDAIRGGAGEQTVVLGPGSRVFGRIGLGGGDDSVTVVGAAGPSARITVENTEVIALTGETNSLILRDDTVYSIDPTGQSFLSAAVSGLTGSAHGAIARRAPRLTDGAAGSGSARAPLQLASLESDTRPRASAGLRTAQRRGAAGADGPAAWGEAFGSSGNRGDDGQTLAYDHDYIGAMGGYETALDTFQLGVAAGFALGSIDTQESSIDTDVESYFVGLYGERDFGTLRLSGSLIGGYEDYESDRLVIDNLNGFETARSDFDNFFISPSVALAAGLPVAEGLELRPSGNATYTAAFYDSYTEEGTTASNLSVDSRTVQVLNTRLQMAVALLPAGAEIELRGGLEGRFSDQDDVDGSLAGANFSFATTEDDSVYGGYVGMNVQVFAADRLSVSGDVEYRSAGADEDQLRGALRATYRF